MLVIRNKNNSIIRVENQSLESGATGINSGSTVSERQVASMLENSKTVFHKNKVKQQTLGTTKLQMKTSLHRPAGPLTHLNFAQ